MATEKESPGTGKLEEEEDQDKLVDTSEASEVGKSKKSKKRKKKKASKDQQTEPEGESVSGKGDWICDLWDEDNWYRVNKGARM